MLPHDPKRITEHRYAFMELLDLGFKVVATVQTPQQTVDQTLGNELFTLLHTKLSAKLPQPRSEPKDVSLFAVFATSSRASSSSERLHDGADWLQRMFEDLIEKLTTATTVKLLNLLAHFLLVFRPAWIPEKTRTMAAERLFVQLATLTTPSPWGYGPDTVFIQHLFVAVGWITAFKALPSSTTTTLQNTEVMLQFLLADLEKTCTLFPVCSVPAVWRASVTSPVHREAARLALLLRRNLPKQPVSLNAGIQSELQASVLMATVFSIAVPDSSLDFQRDNNTAIDCVYLLATAQTIVDLFPSKEHLLSPDQKTTLRLLQSSGHEAWSLRLPSTPVSTEVASTTAARNWARAIAYIASTLYLEVGTVETTQRLCAVIHKTIAPMLRSKPGPDTAPKAGNGACEGEDMKAWTSFRYYWRDIVKTLGKKFTNELQAAIETHNIAEPDVTDPRAMDWRNKNTDCIGVAYLHRWFESLERMDVAGRYRIFNQQMDQFAPALVATFSSTVGSTKLQGYARTLFDLLASHTTSNPPLFIHTLWRFEQILTSGTLAPTPERCALLSHILLALAKKDEALQQYTGGLPQRMLSFVKKAKAVARLDQNTDLTWVAYAVRDALAFVKQVEAVRPHKFAVMAVLPQAAHTTRTVFQEKESTQLERVLALLPEADRNRSLVMRDVDGRMGATGHAQTPVKTRSPPIAAPAASAGASAGASNATDKVEKVLETTTTGKRKLGPEQTEQVTEQPQRAPKNHTIAAVFGAARFGTAAKPQP